MKASWDNYEEPLCAAAYEYLRIKINPVFFGRKWYGSTGIICLDMLLFYGWLLWPS